MEPSPFRESPLSPSEIANYLRDELKRLRKRRQIVTSDSATSVTVAAAAVGPRPRSPPASPGSPEPMVEGQQGHVYQEQQRATSLMIANTGGVLATANLAITPPRPTATTAAASSSPAANKKTDRPVFTLKQMTMICEKMCQVKKKNAIIFAKICLELFEMSENIYSCLVPIRLYLYPSFKIHTHYSIYSQWVKKIRKIK